MSDKARSSFTVSFDSNVYRLAAIKKAAYRMGASGSADIETIGNDRVQVVFTAIDHRQSLNDLEATLRNEVLDQELREQIAGETSQIRDILLAQAFSGISLADQTGEAADFRDDPLNISRSQPGNGRV